MSARVTHRLLGDEGLVGWVFPAPAPQQGVRGPAAEQRPVDDDSAPSEAQGTTGEEWHPERTDTCAPDPANQEARR